VESFTITNEPGVVLFFGRFHKELGFSGWKSASNGYPDCIALQNGKECRIEFEYRSSNFVRHRHDPTKVDLVVCWIKDIELSVSIIELKSFAISKGFTVIDRKPEEQGEHERRYVAVTDEGINSQPFIYEHFFPIKLTIQGGTIIFHGSNSLYSLVPARIVEEVKNYYGLDLIKHRKSIGFEVSICEERALVPDGQTPDPYEIALLVKLRIPRTVWVKKTREASK